MFSLSVFDHVYLYLPKEPLTQRAIDDNFSFEIARGKKKEGYFFGRGLEKIFPVESAGGSSPTDLEAAARARALPLRRGGIFK